MTSLQVVEYSEMDQEERVDPMIYVFPRMTKCHFHKFGPSGTLERHDAFCLLPLNILNEKVCITISLHKDHFSKLSELVY